MKLSYKKVILTGFAFFLICAFWQAYDNIVPLLLVNKFGLNQTKSGIIMALDNVLALFLLPLFGVLSDKTVTKFGRRKPYVVAGTIVAVAAFLFIPLIGNLVLFIVVLLVVLFAMASFRTPAVALMPDVTCKPFRSKGNAVINLMGTAGGIIVLAFGMIFKTSEPGKTDFFFYVLAVGALMLIALAVFALTVKETKWANQMIADSERYFKDKEKEEREEKGGKLSKGQLTSLVFILSSVILWYMGYNAVTSKYSLYASGVLKQDYNFTMMLAQGAAIVSYIPVGIVASKIGRKKTVIAGVLMLFAAFLCAAFIREGSSPVVMYALFALAGIGWATINVNSFPMVVELAKGSDTGRYTGYYYTASMAAQTLTPVLSGAIMDAVGNMLPLFYYAAVCVGLALITMLFVKHGDSAPETPQDKLELLAGGED